ncbi:MAG: DUF4085 family protein [Eubacterium sp.]|nr:DUF4085 family protein [Eubacterium sp.]
MKVFTKEWYYYTSAYNGKTMPYLSYVKENLPRWYSDFSIHDNQIKKVIRTDNLIILDSVYDDYKSTKYQLKFYNPIVIEDCKMENAWCLCDEVYLTEDGCEYHLLIQDFNDNNVLNYFTVKCSNIELDMNGKTFKIIGDSGNKSLFDEQEE